jgi:hypothetical protein
MTESQLQNATLDLIYLGKGRHKSAANGMGTMEAVAWLAGERHSDRPDCTCPVIAAYVRRISDLASDEQRQQLRTFLPRLIGSRSKKHLLPRTEYLVRRAVIVFLPLIYDELQQFEIAAELRATPADATMSQLRNAIRNVTQRFYNATTCAAAAADATAETIAYAKQAANINAAAEAYAATGNDFEYLAIVTAVYIFQYMNIVAAAALVCKAGRQKFWTAALAALDGALLIGPAGDGSLTPAMIERLKMYQALKQKGAWRHNKETS